ncbi:MAG: shikimate kinase [Anaerolineae bacterium]|nr:shikimate kinase [Anaerolineae bacterium]
MSNSDLNLVLTGFMGTGKSTVGRLVAEALERPFVDMDAVIEQRAGRTIPRIFAEQGEAAFRRVERALCRELAARGGQVIATGGGALVDDENRALLIASGLVICLTAAPEALIARLQEESDRPLLAVPDPVARLRELLAVRAEAYAALPYHVETTDLTPSQVAEKVLALWQQSL